MNLFKNLSLFLFLVLTLTVFSCKDDEPSFIGQWRMTSLAAVNCTDSDDNGTISGNASEGLCVEEFGIQGCATIDFTFSADGSASSKTTTTSILGTETETSEGTWEILNDSRLTICLDGDCTTSDYTLTNNQWTSVGVDSESGCDVTTIAVKL